MKRARGTILVIGVAAVSLWAFLRLRSGTKRLSREFSRSGRFPASGLNPEVPIAERRSKADPEALQAMISGDEDKVGLDVNKLRELEEANYKPVVQYVTAIQVQRGSEGETLLFVRRRDLDALAELAGDSQEGLVEHFRELGIIMSNN